MNEQNAIAIARAAFYAAFGDFMHARKTHSLNECAYKVRMDRAHRELRSLVNSHS